jgi:hypothetical protein
MKSQCRVYGLYNILAGVRAAEHAARKGSK